MTMTGKKAANYSVSERLRDGREVVVRAIRPEDKGSLAGQLKELSSESFYRRTFSPKRELSEKELKQMTEVDFEDIVALVAVMREDGQEHIVGGGRYLRMGSSSPGSAEVAFLIDDTHQGLGIGSRIFKHLVAIARSSGITKFEAEVLPSNEGMFRLFDRSGLPVARNASPEAIHVTIELTAAKQGLQMADEHDLQNDLQKTSGGQP
jgi:RimJ/RimL family protein N-acetyltransferase